MPTLDKMQRLLNLAMWDVDGLRDDLCAYTVEILEHPDGGDSTTIESP